MPVPQQLLAANPLAPHIRARSIMRSGSGEAATAADALSKHEHEGSTTHELGKRSHEVGDPKSKTPKPNEESAIGVACRSYLKPV